MAFVDLEKAFDRVPRKVIWWPLRKLGCGGVDCATGAGDVCKCPEPCPWGVHWRVWNEGWFSPRISTQSIALHNCAWSLIMSSTLGSPGKTSMLMTLYHCWIARRRLLTWKEAMKKKGQRNCRKNKDHDLWYGTGPPAEFRRVFMCCLLHWSGQQQLQALGAQEMQWAQALDERHWLQMYTVPGNCTPLGWQTAEGSPGRTWQAWGGSFLLLPNRHALSGRWLWTFNHNTCENRLEEVQGSASSSLFTPPLFQNMWPCVQLLCAERNAPCQQDLAIDKAKPPASAVNWQGNDQTDLQCQAATLSPPGSMSYLCGLALRIWTSFWRRERWYGHVECSNGAVKTAFDKQVDGKRRPGRPKMTWKQLAERNCRDWKLSVINPHDRHTWRSGVRSAMHAASQLS